jgi:hypothetical protein
MNDPFDLLQDTKSYIIKRTCNNTKGLELPDYKKQQYQHSFFVDTVIHWNHLPNSVVHTNSLEAFKTALRERPLYFFRTTRELEYFFLSRKEFNRI